MTITTRKHKSKSGKEYYELVDVRRVKGKVVTRYVGYLGKNLNSKVELTGKHIFLYVERLLSAEISDSDIRDILKKIGIDCDISPITKIVLENDRKLGKAFLRIK